jgi:hypothetical protein
MKKSVRSPPTPVSIPPNTPRRQAAVSHPLRQETRAILPTTPNTCQTERFVWYSRWSQTFGERSVNPLSLLERDSLPFSRSGPCKAACPVVPSCWLVAVPAYQSTQLCAIASEPDQFFKKCTERRFPRYGSVGGCNGVMIAWNHEMSRARGKQSTGQALRLGTPAPAVHREGTCPRTAAGT